MLVLLKKSQIISRLCFIQSNLAYVRIRPFSDIAASSSSFTDQQVNTDKPFKGDKKVYTSSFKRKSESDKSSYAQAADDYNELVQQFQKIEKRINSKNSDEEQAKYLIEADMKTLEKVFTQLKNEQSVVILNNLSKFNLTTFDKCKIIELALENIDYKKFDIYDSIIQNCRSLNYTSQKLPLFFITNFEKLEPSSANIKDQYKVLRDIVDLAPKSYTTPFSNIFTHFLRSIDIIQEFTTEDARNIKLVEEYCINALQSNKDYFFNRDFSETILDKMDKLMHHEKKTELAMIVQRIMNSGNIVFPQPIREHINERIQMSLNQSKSLAKIVNTIGEERLINILAKQVKNRVIDTQVIYNYAKTHSLSEIDTQQILNFSLSICKLDSSLIDSLVDLKMSPLSTIVKYGLHQILHQQPNYNDCLQRIIDEIDQYKILHDSTSNNIMQIQFLHEILGYPPRLESLIKEDKYRIITSLFNRVESKKSHTFNRKTVSKVTTYGEKSLKFHHSKSQSQNFKLILSFIPIDEVSLIHDETNQEHLLYTIKDDFYTIKGTKEKFPPYILQYIRNIVDAKKIEGLDKIIFSYPQLKDRQYQNNVQFSFQLSEEPKPIFNHLEDLLDEQ